MHVQASLLRALQNKTTIADHDDHCTVFINDILQHVWPYATKFALHIVKQTVIPAVQAALPSALGKLTFDDANSNLGDPVRLVNMHMKKEFQDEIGDDIANLVFSAEVAWQSECAIDLAVLGVDLRVHSITLVGEFTAKLIGLFDYAPLFHGISVFFANPPGVMLEVNGAKSNNRSAFVSKLMHVSFIKNLIADIVVDKVNAMLVLPNRLGIPIVAGTDPFTFSQPPPEGLLTFIVWKAEGVLATDASVFGKSTSDPYVKVRCGASTFRSETHKNSLDPIFNYRVHLIICAKSQQKIHIELFDYDNLTKDDFLGRVDLDVHDVINWGLEAQTCRILDENCEFDDEDPRGKLILGAGFYPVLPENPHLTMSTRGLISVGVYSADHVVCHRLTECWVSVSCTHVMAGCDQGPLDTIKVMSKNDEGAQSKVQDVISKLALLRKHGVPDTDISEVLGIDAQNLKDYEHEAQNQKLDVFPREFHWNKGFDFLANSMLKAVVHVQLRSKGLAADSEKSEAKELGHAEIVIAKFLDTSSTENVFMDKINFPGGVTLKVRFQFSFFGHAVHEHHHTHEELGPSMDRYTRPAEMEDLEAFISGLKEQSVHIGNTRSMSEPNVEINSPLLYGATYCDPSSPIAPAGRSAESKRAGKKPKGKGKAKRWEGTRNHTGQSSQSNP